MTDNPEPDMTQRLTAFFSPCVSLRLRSGIFSTDRPTDYGLVAQFKQAADLNGAIRDVNYDDFLRAASDHGYSVEVLIDEPEVVA